MNHSLELHRKLYLLLRDTGNMDDRHEFVLEHTNGRTKKSQDMSTGEIVELIRNLEAFQCGSNLPQNDFQKGDKMRKRVLSLFHQYGYTKYSHQKKRLIIDFEKLDGWMLKYSYLHKKLNKYKYNELPKLVKQVEFMLEKYLEKV